jgi:hypothetical protein
MWALAYGSFQIRPFLWLAYMLLGIPSFVIGLAAAISFTVRGRVQLTDVVMAGLFLGLVLFGLNVFFSEHPQTGAINFAIIVGMPIIIGLTNWMLVRSIRKPIVP